jgi:hypothetical protein
VELLREAIVGEGFHSAGAPFGGVGARPVEGLIGVSKLSELFSLGFRNIFSKSPLLRLIVEFNASVLPVASGEDSGVNQ